MIVFGSVKKYLSILLLVLTLCEMGMTPPRIRVVILKNQSKVVVEGEDLVPHFPNKRLEIEGTAQGFNINGISFLRTRELTLQSLKNPLTMEGKNFIGKLEIHNDNQNKLTVVNDLPLEEYLIGLVQKEISETWPTESIKAQAVAARTYALLKQKERNKNGDALYDVEATTEDQVYEGIGKEDWVIQKAVQETAGEVLWYLGFFPAYYHSCCGGNTELASHVWERKENSNSVADPFCKDSPKFFWEYRISKNDLLKKLRKEELRGKRILSLNLTSSKGSPRVGTVEIKTDQALIFLRGTDFRSILGNTNLRSTWFTAKASGSDYIFHGRGYGHGVGMCQWGAKGMSEEGKTYQEILEFYYPKAVIKKIY